MGWRSGALRCLQGSFLMPFLTVELDAVNLAADLGRAAGLAEAEAGFGLIRMWAWCFRNEQDRVLTAQIAGFFGGDPERVAPACASFGFLEALADGRWRVRGADRYLRLAEARRKGGQAAKQHLLPGGRKAPSASAGAEGAAQHQPGLGLGSHSALSPITDHRSPDQKDLIPESDQNVMSAAARLQGLWQELMPHPPFPRWVSLSDDRKRAAKARWEENPSEGYWREVIGKISRSPWCRGEVTGRDGKSWVADPDFLLRPGTHGKAMEGKYDRREAPTPTQKPATGFRVVRPDEDIYREGEKK